METILILGYIGIIEYRARTLLSVGLGGASSTDSAYSPPHEPPSTQAERLWGISGMYPKHGLAEKSTPVSPQLPMFTTTLPT